MKQIISVLILLLAFTVPAVAVGVWERHVVTLPNTTFTGNPFLLNVDATFTHAGSGESLTLPGYYAGNNNWKIGFMPTKEGNWTYLTASIDSELNGKTGTITAVASGRPGVLKGDPAHPKKWKYADGDYVVPIGMFVQLMHSNASAAEFTAMADFLQVNKIQLINFRLTERDIAFADVGNLQMDLAVWDRLEERLNILAERNSGVDIMLYTDDDGKPNYSAKSVTEQFLLRYLVARVAGYPVVMYNSGIDIWEYRGSEIGGWHDWFGNFVKSLDPYGHPVSSRGRGESMMSPGIQTYNSGGSRNSKFADMIRLFNYDSVPSSNNDNFGEDKEPGDINAHTPADIRRAGWKGIVSGGVGFHVRHNATNDCALGIISNCDKPFTVTGIQSQLDSEQWLKLVNPFVQTRLGATFGSMVPDSGLVTNGFTLADPARTKILYLYMGVNDTWDNGTSSPMTVKLTKILSSDNIKCTTCFFEFIIYLIPVRHTSPL